MTGFRNPRQAEKFKELYLQGQTLKQIGNSYGVSGERVRQVLKKLGITGKDGKFLKNAKTNKANREASRRKRILIIFGCTLEQYNFLRDFASDYTDTPIFKYCMQRSQAKRRGIDFYLTLWEWWSIWKKSGKYEQRGTNYGQYVMCRNMDSGPYEVGNVFIATCSDNSSVQHKPYGRSNDWMAGKSLSVEDLYISIEEEIESCSN